MGGGIDGEGGLLMCMSPVSSIGLWEEEEDADIKFG
jgi:hypothetical protein